jgi:hypothetical protein
VHRPRIPDSTPIEVKRKMQCDQRIGSAIVMMIKTARAKQMFGAVVQDCKPHREVRKWCSNPEFDPLENVFARNLYIVTRLFSSPVHPTPILSLELISAQYLLTYHS